MGIELVEDRASKARAYDAAEQVMYTALEKGLSFKVGSGNLPACLPVWPCCVPAAATAAFASLVVSLVWFAAVL
eukprot:SAG22_NODE_210_length_15092_cov_81.740946_14_plen_74_part_00